MVTWEFNGHSHNSDTNLADAMGRYCDGPISISGLSWPAPGQSAMDLLTGAYPGHPDLAGCLNRIPPRGIHPQGNLRWQRFEGQGFMLQPCIGKLAFRERTKPDFLTHFQNGLMNYVGCPYSKRFMIPPKWPDKSLWWMEILRWNSIQIRPNWPSYTLKKRLTLLEKKIRKNPFSFYLPFAMPPCATFSRIRTFRANPRRGLLWGLWSRKLTGCGWDFDLPQSKWIVRKYAGLVLLLNNGPWIIVRAGFRRARAGSVRGIWQRPALGKVDSATFDCLVRPWNDRSVR